MGNVFSLVPLVIGVKMVYLLFYEPKYLTQYYFFFHLLETVVCFWNDK